MDQLSDRAVVEVFHLVFLRTLMAGPTHEFTEGGTRRKER